MKTPNDTPESPDVIQEATENLTRLINKVERGLAEKADIEHLREVYEYCVKCALSIESEDEIEFLCEVKAVLAWIDYLTGINRYWVHPFITIEQNETLFKMVSLFEFCLEDRDV